MKKIAALFLLAVSCLMSGCTDADQAIADYCTWESYCTYRSYDECRDIYRRYSYNTNCDDAIIEMSDAYQAMSCSLYRAYANGVPDPCYDYARHDYVSKYDCDVVFGRVISADSRLESCLAGYDVEYIEML